MQTLFIGKNIIFLPETESTNSYASDLLKNVNLPEGTLVHTAHQTRGRGQRGSVWKSDPASNLTVSILLKPTFLELKNHFFLYQILALACHDTLAQQLNNSQIDIKIKWPNDLLVDRRKIAGILIENNITHGRINWCVAGIGLNVNQLLFPSDLNATSLQLAAGHEFVLGSVMASLCEHLERYYLLLRSGRLEDIRQLYLSRLLGLGAWMPFEQSGVVHDLFVEGVSEEGRLRLRRRSGEVNDVDVKEVRWIF